MGRLRSTTPKSANRRSFLVATAGTALACAIRPRVARATGGLDIGDDGAALHQVRVLLSTGGYATPQTIDAWHFAWRGRTFRGTYRTVTLPDGRNALVNTLPLDAYLYGVLSKEVGASWASSAQQAQAIVARTYALLKLRPEKPYDVTPGDADQNYGGIESETVEGRAAVDATAGVIVTYAGLPAHVAYSSCCGGRTADAGDVWDTPYPYLRSIVDTNCAGTPDYAWQADVPLAVVEGALGKQLTSCGTVHSVALRADDATSRPRAIAFVGKSSTFEAPVAQFRASVSPTLVRSTYIRNAVLARDGNALSLAGTGRGHGVGLCQWGTRVLGESGMTAENIVSFYFPGIAFGRG